MPRFRIGDKVRRPNTLQRGEVLGPRRDDGRYVVRWFSIFTGEDTVEPELEDYLLDEQEGDVRFQAAVDRYAEWRVSMGIPTIETERPRT